MATSREAFSPQIGKTMLIAATTTSTPVAFAGLGAVSQVRIANTGTSACRIEFGASNQVAVTVPVAGGVLGSMLIPAGVVEVFSLPSTSTFVATQAVGGATTLELTPGIGL